MLDLFRHLRIHTQKKPKDEPEEMDFPEMYLMGLGATTELPDNFEREKYLDEVRISDYVVDTLRDIKRSKSSRNLKLKGGDIKIDTDTANKMLDFLDNMTSPMGKRKIVDILDRGTKKDFMKVNQAVMKAVR